MVYKISYPTGLGYVNDHYFKTSPKLLYQSTAYYMRSILGSGETNDCSWYNLGYMTKMATTPIYGENPSKIFSGTEGPLTLQLGK